MKLNFFLLVVLSTILVCCDSSIDESSQQVPPNEYLSDNQIVVRYKIPKDSINLDSIFRVLHVTEVSRCSCGDETLELWTIDPGSTNIEDAVSSLSEEEGAEGVEGDRQFHFEIPNAGNPNGQILNDNFTQNDITVVDNSESKVDIAIIDTGIDYYRKWEPDLFFFRTSNSISYCDGEVSGWDFVNGDNDVFDDHNHGTYVTKIITNELNKRGIGFRILPIKAFDSLGKGSYWNLVCSMNYVKKIPQISIVNASFGHYLDVKQDILKGLIQEMSQNTLIVSSSGNRGWNTDQERYFHYPSGYPEVNILSTGGFSGIPEIIEGNKITNVERASGSNFGPINIDVAAPFYDYALEFKTREDRPLLNVNVSGTSYSAALVTANVAEILQESRERGEFQIPETLKELLLSTSYISDELKSFFKGGKIIPKNPIE
ncbi:S8 family peptidase [Aquimarina spongiae]|uniref:Subtilase family protein n=1 Tax=Aquimarina spongiae TaxID=570521 RepID=A0A1M6IXX9_9FLAO|nr:S8 family serine peptidase [Aquimarina spongiae]SHJ39267.1 Subtilase family protein [Aquimarina spongiae]